jgi:hypothetical protein
MKISLAVVELLHADRWKDIHGEANKQTFETPETTLKTP